MAYTAERQRSFRRDFAAISVARVAVVVAQRPSGQLYVGNPFSYDWGANAMKGAIS